MLLGISVCVSAQTITGTVTSATDGSTLPGVSVAVKGTTSGTTTDVDGNFSIPIQSDKAVLVFTYVGFKTQEVTVTNTSKSMKIVLVENAQQLSEVVVTAYGTAKKANLTTAQVGVTSKQINETVNTTLEQAIQGRAAGVYMTQNSGQPGGGISINIRGINSLTGNTQPLYVIDGVVIQQPDKNNTQENQLLTNGANPLAGLNPADVDDIQILQGPSASALYGSQATNGVILITTKRGKAGGIKINYGYQLSDQAPPKHLPMMNLPEYAQLYNDYVNTAGGTAPGEFADPSLLGPGTDWQKALFRNAAMNKHQLSLSGGTDNLRYYMSGDYTNQNGVAQGSDFKRYGFRLNLDNNATKWLTIGLNLNYNQINETSTTTADNLINSALQLTPQIPVKNFDGTWGGSDPISGQYAPVNPVAISSLVTNQDVKRQFTGGGNLQINFFPGFIFKTSFNTNIGYLNTLYYMPTYNIDPWHIQNTNSMTDGANFNTYWSWNELFEYTKQLGQHNLDVMASHESQESTWKNLKGSREGFLTNTVFDLQAGDPNTATNGGGHGDWAMESWLGRINYNYAERYLFSTSIRADGSSNFGANNRWGYFPAISAAWRISKEPWYGIKWMNEVKLRGETGTTGNQGSGGIYSSMVGYPTIWGAGFMPNQYANPDLKWESTTTYNIGINLGFLQNRIQFEGDYYVKNTNNLIMQAPLPAYMGVGGSGGTLQAPQVNFGSLRNTGLAFTINSTNINTKTFTWTSNFNISGDRPIITKLNTNSSQAVRTAWWMNNYQQVCQVGKAPWLFYGYVAQGIFQSTQEINSSAVPVDNTGKRLPTDPTNGVWVGDVKYKDLNGDGVITPTDQTTIGNPWPKFFGGFTNTFSYKGFDLNILLTFTYGNQIYNYQAYVNSNPHNIYVGQNCLQDVTNYARPSSTTAGDDATLLNPNASVPRINNTDLNGNWNNSSKWVEDGSFLRVKNIGLTYTVPKSFVKKQNIIKDLTLTISAQNVWTLTKYSGFDPEVGSAVGTNTSATAPLIGVDYGHYPLTPIYTFSVNVNL